MALSYLNFDLLIDRIGDRRYRANVTASPVGEGSNDFDLPFGEEALRGFVVDVVPGTARGNVPATDAPELLPVKEFGEKLCASVFGGSVRDCFVTSLSEARRQRAGLRIRLRLGSDSGLVNLPWECMFDPVTREFLGLRKAMSIVRYVPLTSAPSPLAVEPPLRILAVVSSPRGYPPIDADRELLNLRNSLKELIAAGHVVLEPLETPTLGALQERLDQVDYHIFHFIGHGEFDPDARRGVLVLEDGAGGPDPVSAESMGTILQQDSLRLVILNACEGGRSSAQDPFAGTAQTLVRNDIPAVIAMQFMITDQAAIEFSRRFYGGLAANRPVDAAVSEARRRISTQVNAVEWATPVLYMRPDDGRIFDLQTKEGTPPIVLDEPDDLPLVLDEPDDDVDLEEDRQPISDEPAEPEPVVTVPPPPERLAPAVSVAAALERVSPDPHGPQRFRLVLDNYGREDTRVHLTVEDREQALILDLSSDSVVLPPGGETTTDLVVRPRGRGWSTHSHEHPFVVVVEPTGDSPKVLRGVVVRPPTLTPVRMLLAALAVVVIGVLGFVVLRPHPEPNGGGGGGGGGGTTELPGTIAYVRDGAIFAATPHGSLGTNLTAGVDGRAREPAWSPDQDWMAFTVTANGVSSIYRVDANGDGLRRLTSPPAGANDGSPAISPDGTEIAFVRGPPHAFRLYVMHADGSGIRTVDGLGNDSRPAWSRDGETIVFHRAFGGVTGLATVAATGGEVTQVTTNPTDQSPTWTPSTVIVFHSKVGEKYFLFTLNLETGASAPMGVDGAEPAWSPDGRYIAFHRGDRVLVTTADGSDQQAILTSEGPNPDPAW